MFSCPFANRLYHAFELLSGVDVKFGQWNGGADGNIQYYPALNGERGRLTVSSSDRRELIHEIAHWTVGRRDMIEYGLPTQEQQEDGAEWGNSEELQTLALEYSWRHLAGLGPNIDSLDAVTGSRRPDSEDVQRLIRYLPHAARYSSRLPADVVELIVEVCRLLPHKRSNHKDSIKLGQILSGLLTRLYGSFEDDDDAQAT